MSSSKKLRQWITNDSSRFPALFNPFVYIAGWKALFIGLVAILAAGYLGSFSKTHFDGVLDVHSGASAPQWFYLVAGIIDWLCMGVVLLILGKVVAKKPFRAIDLLGTQAMARWPTVITVLAALPPAYSRMIKVLVAYSHTHKLPSGPNPVDVALFAGAVIVMLMVLIWMIKLMYGSYKISCNPEEAKAGRTFVIGLVAAEILSKAIIITLIRQF